MIRRAHEPAGMEASLDPTRGAQLDLLAVHVHQHRPPAMLPPTRHVWRSPLSPLLKNSNSAHGQPTSRTSGFTRRPRRPCRRSCRTPSPAAVATNAIQRNEGNDSLARLGRALAIVISEFAHLLLLLPRTRVCLALMCSALCPKLAMKVARLAPASLAQVTTTCLKTARHLFALHSLGSPKKSRRARR